MATRTARKPLPHAGQGAQNPQRTGFMKALHQTGKLDIQGIKKAAAA
jgi:hypothetical protein